jgi:hypothetical protein
MQRLAWGREKSGSRGSEGSFVCESRKKRTARRGEAPSMRTMKVGVNGSNARGKAKKHWQMEKDASR